MVMFADNKMYNKDYKKVNVGGGGGGGVEMWHLINGRILQGKMLRNIDVVYYLRYINLPTGKWS